MRLFNSVGPNPKVVRMFLAEKNLTLPVIEIDLRGGENRQAPYTDKNPSGQCPCLELDNGTYLSEITAICEYIEDKQPAPTLIGSTPEEKAETRMWVRRIDLNILEPMANGFRYSTGLKMFQERIHCIPQAADDLKTSAQEKLAWLDGLMADRAYVCGDRFTLADIMLFVFVDFFNGIDQPMNPDLKNIAAWHGRIKERDSANA